MTLGLSIRSLFILGLLSLVSCGGGGGSKSNPPSSSSAHAISTSSASSISSAAPDTTPGTFSFNEISNAELGVLVTSSPVTISGINAAASISVVGGEYSIDGGQFTAAAGTISNGQTLAVRVTSSEKTYTPKEAVVKVGEVTAKFTVTTFADVTPDAFTFTPVKEATLNTEYASSVVTVKGIDVPVPVPVPVSINGGVYSINGGAFTSAAGTVSADQTITVKVTSAPKTDTTNTAVLTIGGVTGSFAVSTFADKTPPVAEFKFPTPYTMSEANKVKVRGVATDDNAITEVKLLVRSYNLGAQDTTLDEAEVVAVPASETDGVKDFSSWTATIPLTADAENEITVIATDEKNNVIALEEANKVVIRQSDVNNAFPNETNPFGSPYGGIVIDKYEGRNRLLISDQSKYKVFAVSITSGERTVYKADENKLLSGLLAVEQNNIPMLYALDQSTSSLQKMNLSDGAVIGTYQNNDYKKPYKLVLDSSDSSRKIVTVNTGVPNKKNSDVIAFDLETEIFSIISSDLDYPTIPGAEVIAFDNNNNRYLVNLRDIDINLYGIYSVSKRNGERQALSTNEVGGGALFESRAGIGEIFLDTARNVLYAFPSKGAKVYEINLLNGDRRILTELKYTGRYGDVIERSIISAVLEEADQFAYIGDSSGGALLIVDLTSGEQLVLSKSENQ